MGYGDEVMATGFARLNMEQYGKKTAFGKHGKIVWNEHTEEVFKNNPNIVRPGEDTSNAMWNGFVRSNRCYCKSDGKKWTWNTQFNPPVGEFFFTKEELDWAEALGSGFVVIEPRIMQKTSAVNKQWDPARYYALADHMRKDGYEIRQFVWEKLGVAKGQDVKPIPTPSFRHAAAALARAILYVGPEGGIHHVAAAVGTPAVVLFGAWIHPGTTGYEDHVNIYVGGDVPCGNIQPCQHCKDAMNKITVKQVYNATHMFGLSRFLKRKTLC